MKHYFNLLMFFLLMMTAACSFGKKQKVIPSMNIEVPESERDQIVFLIFKVKENPSGETPFVSLDKHLTPENRIKDDVHYEETDAFEFVIMDANGQVQKSISQENPLTQSYEYGDEEGQVQSKEISRKEASLPFRFNYKKEYHHAELRFKKKPLFKIIF